VATPELLEFRLTIKPSAGAGDESSNVRFCIAVPVIVALFGKKLSVAITRTVLLSPLRPKADAVMLEDPKATPVTIGEVFGVVAPSKISTFAGDTVTFDVSLLLSETNTPPAGAGLRSVRDIGANAPGSTVTLEPRSISGGGTTVRLAVASGISGRALA
jgi:hypothetical protein